MQFVVSHSKDTTGSKQVKASLLIDEYEHRIKLATYFIKEDQFILYFHTDTTVQHLNALSDRMKEIGYQATIKPDGWVVFH